MVAMSTPPGPGTRMVELSGGRLLEVLEGGDPAGPCLVLFDGQPSAAVASREMDHAARGAGLRLLTFSRPGYGASTPRGELGVPQVRDDVADTVELLDLLGIGEFLTLGWSGGGPRALACAALLPGRCGAATSLAGVAPYEAEDLDWSAGMAPENVAEYAAAAAGREAYGAYLTESFLPVLEADADELSAALGELVPPVDRATLEAGYAEHLARSFQHAAAQGVVGCREDGLALVAPWGVDLATITVPVAIWQGSEDAMVPVAHGRWLASHVPGAVAHLVDGEGHLSLVDRLPEILAELRELARV